MKILFFIFFTFFFLTIRAGDTLDLPKVSIGFTFSPATFYRWSFPESKNVITSQSSRELYIDETKTWIFASKGGFFLIVCF